jgi:hypothetical protein
VTAICDNVEQAKLIIGILVFLAQNRYWKGRVKVLDLEVKRLSQWKSDRQQAQIATILHHTENPPPPKKKK